MVLLLTNEDMEHIEDLSMRTIIDSVESAYRELGQGVAASPARRRLIVSAGAPTEARAMGGPTHWSLRGSGSQPPPTYWFNNIMGAVPGCNTMALRVDSAFFRLADVGGATRKVRAGDFVGLVLLFNTTTGELEAILHDHYLSTRRVAATGAVGARYLARPNARVMGLFGSGQQATTQVLAMAAVRPLELIKVYSPNVEHRRAFAAQMAQEVDCEVRAIDDPRAVVEGCDIVVTATNSRSPVFDGRSLAPGTHLETIVGTDQSASGSEIDREAVHRANLIVTNLKEQIQIDRQPKLLWAVEEGILDWNDIHDLSEVVGGRAKGRTSERQITLHDNNTGMGIQFAALGALILERARAQRLGTTLPDELFMTRGGDYAP